MAVRAWLAPAVALAFSFSTQGAAAIAEPAPFAPPDPAARVSRQDGGGWAAVETTCPALPADASLRQRIVDVAAEEWARFGFQTEELTRTGLSVVVRPRRGEIIPRVLNRVKPWITRRALRLGRMEDERSVAAAIAGYWSATPDSQAIAIQNRLDAVYDGTGWAVPWSAAFISYVVCAAGVGDLEQFRRSEGHWAYVDQAIAATDGTAPRAIYRARDIETGLPRPGDLVCLDRTGGSLRSVEAKRQAPGEAPLHCDVVVMVDARHRLAAMIGGNVEQSVTMSLVNIVPARKSAPTRLQRAEDVRGARPFFVVLALATGGEASLDKAPAIGRIAGR